MKKLFITSTLTFLLVLQTSIMGLHPKSIIYIPYKLLFGGLSGIQQSSLVGPLYTLLFGPLYTLLCGATIYAAHVAQKNIIHRQINTKKTQPQIQSSTSCSSKQTPPIESVKRRPRLSDFGDQYQKPTKEEWDAFMKYFNKNSNIVVIPESKAKA
ncbi:hypothetical protein EKK58_02460 [Candidatus Dependentiae bacterium]|nr:MAG: hypothetical protein EKK58_02460 [Candidatus Dependentiae bacterium]